MSIPKPWAGIALAALVSISSAGCAAPAGGNDRMNQPPMASQAISAGARFIVKYREGSLPARDKTAVQARLDALAPEGVALTWQRRLGVQADLFTTSRALDADEAEALMQRFRNDADVEYIEPDGRAGIDPIRGPAMRPPGD